MAPEPTTESCSRVLPLVSDAGNHQLLVEWLTDHPSYEPVELAGGLAATEFDVCILDGEAFHEHLDALRAEKTATAPVLLPYLLLLPEGSSTAIDTDAGQLADSVVTQSIDEVVTLPIQQGELQWRLQALLRLRDQSTTLRNRERELERQVDLFEKAQELANVGAWEYDVVAEEGVWTEAVYHIHDLPEDVTPSPELSLQQFHPDDRPAVRAAFEAAVEEGEPYDVEARLVADAGAISWVRTRGEPQYEGEKLVRVRGTIQDITERKEREETLTRHTKAIEEAPVGIGISDPAQADNPLIYVNDAFVEMTGYPREETVGSNCRFLQGDATDPDRVAEVREAIDDGEPVSVDLQNYRRDGTEFWNHLEVAPVTDDDGEVANWVGFQQDVTERKQRQEQLAVLDRVLRHNLRNDMNMIRGLAETINAESTGDIASFAARIMDRSDRLVELTEKERQITALLQTDPALASFDVRETLQAVASSVESEHPDATIDVDCPDGIEVDATTRFEQAVDELVTNAVVHSDSPSPEVTASATETDERVRIEIADDGPEIPAVERELLTGQAEKTPLYHGSGLGLWLVKLLVARSHGTTAVEANTPTGNVVSITLPK